MKENFNGWFEKLKSKCNDQGRERKEMRRKKEMVIGDKPTNLSMHAPLFHREHSEMHQKQPQNDNFGLLNQPYAPS
jgi:hypothetical protein